MSLVLVCWVGRPTFNQNTDYVMKHLWEDYWQLFCKTCRYLEAEPFLYNCPLSISKNNFYATCYRNVKQNMHCVWNDVITNSNINLPHALQSIVWVTQEKVRFNIFVRECTDFYGVKMVSSEKHGFLFTCSYRSLTLKLMYLLLTFLFMDALPHLGLCFIF